MKRFIEGDTRFDVDFFTHVHQSYQPLAAVDHNGNRTRRNLLFFVSVCTSFSQRDNISFSQRDDDNSFASHRYDTGCRNTVFNATAQSGAEYVGELTAAGVRHFRVELVDEPAAVVAPLMEGYREVLAGERRGVDLVEWVGTLPDANGRSHGAGRGSLEVRRERDRGAMKQTAAAKNAAARLAAKGR